MKKRRIVSVLVVAIILTISALGLAATKRDNQKNQPNIGYKIKGTMEPIPGHSFPKSWGRVVTYFIQPGGNYWRMLVFEAEDGTIRMVRVDLDWDKHRIEDVDVITIGRD